MDGEARLRRAWETCPADLFRREAPLWERLARRQDVPLDRCRRDPVACLDGCLILGSGPHCFSLARAFETGKGADPRYAQMLFSIACAVGRGAGCTNRAAGIRNGRYRGDPFLDAPEEARQSCQHRSFRIACEQGDAWGCAMLGQSYQLGEGVEGSDALARQAYETSCRLNPAFVACDFAKRHLEELGR